MGTSTEMKRTGGGRSRKDEVIAWEFIPINVRQELVVRLNPEMTLSGNDWRMLASKLGYTQADIMFIESEKETNTSLLFNMYGQKPNATLNEVYNCLEEMSRKDCLDIIDKAYEDISRLASEKRFNGQRFPASDGAEGMTMGHYQWSVPVKCPLHPSSLLSSPSHCTCYCSMRQPYLPQFSHPEHCGRNGLFRCDNSRGMPSLPSPQLQLQSVSHRTIAHGQTSEDRSQMQTNISPFDNSNISGNYNSHDSMNTHLKMARQYSDESNSSPRCCGREDRPYQNGSGNTDVSPGLFPHGKLGYKWQKSGEGSAECSCDVLPASGAASADFGRGRHCPHLHQVGYSHGQDYLADGILPNGVGADRDMPSLARLESMIRSHEKFQPSTECGQGKEQKTEADMKRRNDKDWGDSYGSTSLSSSSSSGSSSRSGPSSTFPLRIKCKTPDMVQLTNSKKSTSMPQNMKPEEFRKVFRNTKIFVTYTFDHEDHGRQVLSLCKFLQVNGFACYVDVRQKSSVNLLEHLEWCSKKIFEADFVLVCLSPKYLQDINKSKSLNQNVNHSSERQLQHKEIYTLLENAYLKDNDQATVKLPQVVPLLFGGMKADGLPPWMTLRSPVYNWPHQYMDLAWMLTKPQERIKTSRHSSRDSLEMNGGATAVEQDEDMSVD